MLVPGVGNRHVALFYPGEAKYFAIDNPATQGKVMTVQMWPVYDDSGKEITAGIDLVAAVKPLMKPGHYGYLPLPGSVT